MANIPFADGDSHGVIRPRLNAVLATSATSQGSFDASGAAFPAPANLRSDVASATATARDFSAAITVGDWWVVSTAGVIATVTVPAGSIIIAVVDSPAAAWGPTGFVLLGAGSTGGGLSSWAGTTSYAAGDTVITPTGAIVSRTAAGNSGAAFDATEAGDWTFMGNSAHVTASFVGSGYYYAGQIAVNGAFIMSRVADGAAAATFTVGEAANWTHHSQSTVASWAATTVYVAGQQVRQDGILWERTATGTSGAAFDAAEQTTWTALSADGSVQAWAASTVYQAGDAVITPTGALVSKLADGASTVTFDATEAALWSLLAPNVSTLAFVGSGYYYVGQHMVEDGSTFAATTAHDAAATFTLAEAGNWSYISQETIGGFQGAHVYVAGEQIAIGSILWERISTGTSTGSFNASELAFWTPVSGTGHLVSWAASTVYPNGATVITPSGAMVTRTAAKGVSGATFDATEAADWSMVGNEVFVFSWIANAYYYANQITSVGLSPNFRIARVVAGMSGATLDAAEINGRWILVSQSTLGPWSAAQVYPSGYRVTHENMILRANSALFQSHTSDATFTLAESANWDVISDDRLHTVTVTATGTVAAADFEPFHTAARERIIYVNSGANATITLDPDLLTPGNRVTIKDISGNASSFNITVSAVATIDGTTTKTIIADYGIIRLVDEGGAWYSL